MRQDYFNEKHEGKVLTISPRACYDEGKRFAETSVATYQQTKISMPRLRVFFERMVRVCVYSTVR